MANIRTDVSYMIRDGAEVVFKAPCDCSTVSGLSVYYPDMVTGKEESKEFVFKDAHGNNLADVDNLFTAGVYVKVILNVTDSVAYIQNADSNSYLEGRFNDIGDASTHIADKSNPHGVTKSQVGLSNVPNVATNDQTPTFTEASSNSNLTSGEKLSVAFGKIAKAIKSLISHLADTTSHVTSTERSTWNGKANASHGNHVPSTQTASNKVFLRNDNTWQTVTPANIGAAASSHNQAASTISAGTLGGKVQANATAMATLTNAQVRDSVILDSDPGEGASVSYNPGTIVWTK